tara:strand:- start:2080 stop:2721 length:642 start_codon:yes stop_codon:yes gene_type:complete
MKLTLNIPTTLKEITLEQYQQWLKVADGKEMSLFLQQKMIEIFCNTPLKSVLDIRANDVDEITNSIGSLFDNKTTFVDRFELNNKEFGFIYDLDKISLGEFVDLDKLTEWDLMHKAMAVLYRPITFKKGNKYLIEDYESSSKYNMKNMRLDIVFGALVFFWNLNKESTTLILKFLASHPAAEYQQELKALQKNMDGFNQFMDSAWEMSEGLTK